MGRPRQARLIVTGTLVAQSPLHVGGMRDGIESDMPLYRNGMGQVCIPGTSLAGPMREWMRNSFDTPARTFCKSEDQESSKTDSTFSTFGYQKQDEKDVLAQGMASFIMVEDAPVIGDDHQEIWDHVGIDREYGAAAAQVKFDRTVVPKGTKFEFRMVVEVPPKITEEEKEDKRYQKFMKSWPDPDYLESRIAHLVEALEQGNVRMGGGRTRGLGRFRLFDSKIEKEDWGTRAGIIDMLNDKRSLLKPDDLKDENKDDSRPTKMEQLNVTIIWHPVGPLMVKSPFDGVAVDMLPFVSRNIDHLTLTLPGSSIKGALRSHAERIMRTVFGWQEMETDPPERYRWSKRNPGPNSMEKKLSHLEQLDVPVVNHLFGSAKLEKRKDNEDTSEQGGRGWLEVDTCYSENVELNNGQWESIAFAAGGHEVPTTGEKTKLYQALGKANLAQADSGATDTPFFTQGYHVAIDRWTGAASDSALYSAIEPFNVEWEPLRFTLTFPPQAESENRLQSIALLLLTLQDFMQGDIPLGFGTNRGYGQVAVDNITFEAEGKSETIEWLQEHKGVTVDNLFANCPQELKTAWANAIKENSTGGANE